MSKNLLRIDSDWDSVGFLSLWIDVFQQMGVVSTIIPSNNTSVTDFLSPLLL